MVDEVCKPFVAWLTSSLLASPLPNSSNNNCLALACHDH
jgi:hypothetical protein